MKKFNLAVIASLLVLVVSPMMYSLTPMQQIKKRLILLLHLEMQHLLMFKQNPTGSLK